MKIIFLDFDGVINSTASFIQHKKAREAGTVDMYANPAAPAVALVERLIMADPEIRVVISSTWRNMGDVPALRRILEDLFGMSGDATAMVIDKTRPPKMSRTHRGHEVQDWLASNGQKHKVTHYVILDDNSDFTEKQKEHHFVQTNPDNGFTWDDYKKARGILGVEKDGFFIL